MSFGFSPSDFLTVGKLIADIVDGLRNAKSEYRDVIRELECLKDVLIHIDGLQANGASQRAVDSIKYTALSCRRPLEDFLVKSKTFEEHPGIRNTSSPIKSTASRLRWSSRKQDILRMQSYLSVHVGTLNALLAELGLQKLDSAAQLITANQSEVRQHLADTRCLVQQTRGDVAAQTALAERSRWMIEKVYQAVSGNVASSLKTLSNSIAQMCVTTQQIYGVVVEIRDAIRGIDTRFTYFQAPLIVEDALGFQFPIPSEYNYHLVETIISHRFAGGPWSDDVHAGNYELYETRNSDRLVTIAVQPAPGTHITMAIVVLALDMQSDRCPVQSCWSTNVRLLRGGERRCQECNKSFGTARKEQIRQDMVDTSRSTGGSKNSQQVEKKKPNLSTEADLEALKHIRLRCGEMLLQQEDDTSSTYSMQYVASNTHLTISSNTHNTSIRIEHAEAGLPFGRAALQLGKPSLSAQELLMAIRYHPPLKPEDIDIIPMGTTV